MSLTMRDLEICYSLSLEARDIKERLKRLLALAENTASAPAMSLGGGGSRARDRLGDIMAEYVDLEEKGLMRVAKYLQHIKMVELAIDTLDDSVCRRYLRHKYIDGLGRAEIEQIMAYSPRQVDRIRKRSLELLGIEDGAQ